MKFFWFCILPLILLPLFVSGQNSFETSGPCQINVNDPNYGNEWRKPIIDAVFTWGSTTQDKCSGTLINRATTDGNIDYYFLTARHCVSTSNSDSEAPEIDFNAFYTLKFNFQSEGEQNSSTALTNRGTTFHQSTQTYSGGYEYFHRSKLELVGRYYWGDFAICRIVTPLPPHFNITYAGWNSTPFYNGGLTGSPLPPMPSPFVGIHHPRGDIKKVAGANAVAWIETPMAMGCYTITSAIDLLFGWLWGYSQSTQVICNYVDLSPWVYLPVVNYGATEGGSSGSGLFNTYNQLFGVLSGSPGDCEFSALVAYGKLRSNYFNNSVRNALNPSHDPLVDIAGMSHRKISCYDNLELPRVTGVTGHYFPASHYQAENAIVLQAANNISITQPIVIYPEADYTFRAGYDITGVDNIDVEVGANFTAEIAPCSSGRLAENSNLDMMLTKLSASALPKKKVFDRSAYRTPKQEQERSVLYPNPTTGFLTLNHTKQIVQLEVYDAVGRRIQQTFPNANTATVDLSGNAAGIYTVRATLTDGRTETHKVIRQH